MSATASPPTTPAPDIHRRAAPAPEEFRPTDGVATAARMAPPLTELISRESARRRRRRLVRRGLLAGVPLLAAVAWLLLRPRPVPFAQWFRTQPATVGDVVREVTATGNLDAITTVQVGAEISGRIASVNVDYNDRVRAGQVLARFDRTLLAAQRAQTEGAVAAARAALEQARTTRAKAAGDSSRAVQLWERQGITDADRDAAVSAARLAGQAVAAAEAQVSAAEAAYSVARTNLDHTVIRAPIDGVVITRNVDSGQTVASALQTPVLFTVAADLRQMQVVAAVDEADVGEVTTGQQATFTVNAYPDRLFRGRVTQVRNSPVIVQNVVTYGTVIEVANPDLALKPGMTASVRIRTAAAPAVLRVPTAAFTFVPPGRTASGPGVWTLGRDTLLWVGIVPGISDGEFTAIVRGQLTPGTPVVTGLTPQGRAALVVGH